MGSAFFFCGSLPRLSLGVYGSNEGMPDGYHHGVSAFVPEDITSFVLRVVRQIVPETAEFPPRAVPKIHPSLSLKPAKEFATRDRSPLPVLPSRRTMTKDAPSLWEVTQAGYPHAADPGGVE